MDGYVTRRLWLDRDPQALRDWQTLMQAANLSDQETVDYTIGIYDGTRLAAINPATMVITIGKRILVILDTPSAW